MRVAAMKRISSKSSFLTKTLFPILWFGSLAFFAAQAYTSGSYQRDPVLLAAPCLMALAGVFVMKKLIWDLADEVYDEGEFLRIRKAGIEERVPIAGIIALSATRYTNPPRITLQLATPGRLGSEIAFSPAKRFWLNPFARNEVAEDLKARVDQARSRQAC